MSKRERRQYGLQLFGFLRHVLLGLSIILADYSIFWLLDLFRHQLSAEIIARGESSTLGCSAGRGAGAVGRPPGLSRSPAAPSTLNISVNGTGYTSEIFQDLVSAFNVLQEGRISVLSHVCLVEPVEPDHSTYITIGVQTGGCCTLSHPGGGGGCRGCQPCVIHSLPTRNPLRCLALHQHLRLVHGTPAPGRVRRLFPIP